MKKGYLTRSVLCILVFLLVGLSSTIVVANEERLILATTTSTDNSGLLDVLIPPFEKKYDVKVDIVSVGTGKAIALAQNGDADIILVHARAAEEEFVAAGYGVNRRDVMYNDFIILGPKADSAGIRGMNDVRSAFTKISKQKAQFVSRGDDSGTHKKELSVWNHAEITPKGKWYLEVGQGMGASLNIANEKQAYILTDRGTYLAYKDQLDLEIMVQGDPVLYNPYGIIPVNPACHPHVNYQMAMAFVGYITSQTGQQIIRDFTNYGNRLFNPLAIEAKKIVD